MDKIGFGTCMDDRTHTFLDSYLHPPFLVRIVKDLRIKCSLIVDINEFLYKKLATPPFFGY